MSTADQVIARRELERTVQVVDLAIQEALGQLEDDPRLGDNGIAELVVEIENTAAVLRARVGLKVDELDAADAREAMLYRQDARP